MSDGIISIESFLQNHEPGRYQNGLRRLTLSSQREDAEVEGKDIDGVVVVDDEVIRQRLNPIRVFAITCIGGVGVR